MCNKINHEASALNQWIILGLKTAFFSALFLLVSWQVSAAPTLEQLRAYETPEESQEREPRELELLQLQESLRKASLEKVAVEKREQVNNALNYRLAELLLRSYAVTSRLEARLNEKTTGIALTEENENYLLGLPSISFVKKAVEACMSILHSNIPFERLDHVYFFLGQSHRILGDTELSNYYLTEFLRKFPKNQDRLAQVNRELGELRFRDQKYRTAIDFFNRSRSLTPQADWPPILARLSWCHYYLGEYQKALDFMKRVVVATESSSSPHHLLRERALADLTQFMTEKGKTQEAIKYLAQVTGDPGFYVKLLVPLLAKAERHKDTSTVLAIYAALIKIDPHGKPALKARINWFESELKRKNFPQALAKMDEIRFPTIRDTEVNELAQRVREDVLKTADYFTHRKSELDWAEKFYEGYLVLLARAPDPGGEEPEFRMLLADVKLGLKKKVEAASLYRQVALHGNRTYQKQASLRWLTTLQELIQETQTEASTVPTSLDTDFLAALDFIAKNWEGSLARMPQIKMAALRAAQMVARYELRAAEARDRAQYVIEQWPGSQEALSAARLWLELITEMPALTLALRDLRSNSVLMEADRKLQRGKLNVFLLEQDQRLRLHDVTVSEQKQDFITAGNGYEAYGDKNDKAEISEKAYRNAIINFLKTPETQPASIRVASKWVQKFPDSSNAIETFRMAATETLIRGSFELSAAFNEMLGNDLKYAPGLEAAGRIFEGLGGFERAKYDWSQYVQLFPKSLDWGKATLELGRILELQGRNSEAVETYLKCTQSAPLFRPECEARLGDLLLKMGDRTQAILRYRRAVDLDLSSPYTVYCRYQLGFLLEKEIENSPMLQVNDSTLQDEIRGRLSFLGRLTDAYLYAAQGGGHWKVAALYRLGLMEDRISKEIGALKASLGDTPEEQAKFNRPLRKISDDLKKKAKDHWTLAYNQDVELGIFSPVLPEVWSQLLRTKFKKPKIVERGKKGGFKLAGLEVKNLNSREFFSIRDRLLKNPLDSELWTEFGNAMRKFRNPVFSKLFYQIALDINPKLPSAQNNLAVVLLENEEDWLSVSEAAVLLGQAADTWALIGSSHLNFAQYNLALLMNHFCKFKKSKTLWRQLRKQKQSREINEGLELAEKGDI